MPPPKRHSSSSAWGGWAGGLVVVSGLLFWMIIAWAVVALPAPQPHRVQLQQQQQLTELRVSTIPGAGVGLFARVPLPAGTVWNRQDAAPAGTLLLDAAQWDALRALSEHVQQRAGSGPAPPSSADAHPVVAIERFLNIYGYEGCGDQVAYAVSLTPSTCVNHAPSASSAPAGNTTTTTTTTAGRRHSRSILARLRPTNRTNATATGQLARPRTANSGGLPDGAPWVAALSPVEQCTLSVTLRDVAAGEELLEDYRRYCNEGDPCDHLPFARQQQQQQQQPSGTGRGMASRSRPRHALVQLPDVRLLPSATTASNSNSSSFKLLAARPIPAGTVWNVPDTALALRVTRAQWEQLLWLQQELRRLNATRPIINDFIAALRTLGYCCAAGGAPPVMFVPLSVSVFANVAASAAAANTGLAADGAANGSAAQQHAPTAASSCTASRTFRAVAAGEELLHSRWLHTCSWPGFRA